MRILNVKKQPDGTDVSFEGTITSCKAPILSNGLYAQVVRLADGSGTIWASFILGTKRNPLHNGTNIIVKKAIQHCGSDAAILVYEYTIPTTSEPPLPYEHHPAEEPVDWEAKDMRMAKMSSLNNATRLVVCLAETFGTAGAKGLDTEQLKKIANEFLAWIYEERSNE